MPGAPQLRDVVAQEDNAVLAGLRRPEFGIFAAIADETAEIVQRCQLRICAAAQRTAGQNNETPGSATPGSSSPMFTRYFLIP